MAAVPWLCKGSEIPIFLNKGYVQRMLCGKSIDFILLLNWTVSENSYRFIKDEKTPQNLILIYCNII